MAASHIALAENLLRHSDRIFLREDVETAISGMVAAIHRDFNDRFPLILSVMGGAVVFTGHLLCRLSFPLEFDVLKASRYGQATGGGTVEWSLRPKARLKGRSILLLDDILDEGHTLKEIRDWLEQEGAADVKIAVLFDKHHGREKPLSADYVGLALPDRYVFGWGMDVAGYWRNLDEVWALQDSGFELLKG